MANFDIIDIDSSFSDTLVLKRKNAKNVSILLLAIVTQSGHK